MCKCLFYIYNFIRQMDGSNIKTTNNLTKHNKIEIMFVCLLLLLLLVFLLAVLSA